MNKYPAITGSTELKPTTNTFSPDLDMLALCCTLWSTERGIIQNSTPSAQFLKLLEEIGELASSINKKRSVQDDIGDCIVVLNNIAVMNGTTLRDCLARAYEDIKDRTGYLTPEGIFIKDAPKEESTGQ